MHNDVKTGQLRKVTTRRFAVFSRRLGYSNLSVGDIIMVANRIDSVHFDILNEDGRLFQINEFTLEDHTVKL